MLKKYFIEEQKYQYPAAYNKLVELGLLDFDIWYLIESEQATKRYHDLRGRFPKRQLIPFARRDDNDDIACFEIDKPGRVQLIHDFSSEGYEQRGEFSDLWDWLKYAINEMIEYNREEEKQ